MDRDMEKNDYLTIRWRDRLIRGFCDELGIEVPL
jgi:hypothetical protein